MPPRTRLRLWGEGVTAPSVLGAKITGRFEPSPHRKPTLIPISYPKEWQSTIEIDADAPLGTKPWRLTSGRGGTEARPFIVGDMSETVETESNSLPARAEQINLPVTVNGQIAGERDLDYYVFSAQEGQVVTCDCAAARLGSPLDANIEVQTLQGQRLAVQEIRVGSDPVVAFRAARNDDYLVMVSNVSLYGGPQFVYRLTVTTAPYPAFAFPPGGQVGKSSEIQLHCLDGVAEGTRMPRLRPVRETVFFERDVLGEFRYRSPVVAAAPITLVASNVTEMVESEQNQSVESAMPLSLPMTVNGQFLEAGDDDWFTFSADENQSFTIDCQPVPRGGNCIPILEIVDPQGKVIRHASSVESDDGCVRILWQAPKSGDYWIHLRDLQHDVRGGPEFIYRLTVRVARQDFSLRVASGFVSVLPGKTTELELNAQRQGGFNAKVDIQVDGLPQGIRAEPCSIAHDKNSAKLVLVAKDDAPTSDAALRILGRAVVDGKSIERVALASDLGRDAQGVSLGAPRIDNVHLTVRHPPIFRLFCSEAYQYAHRGTVHHYRMQVERLGEFKGPIVLETGDRQNRDLDCVEVLPVVVPPGTTDIDVPIFMPETMHINVQSLTQLYVQAYALFEDKHGESQSTLVVSEKRCLIRTLPTVVKLKSVQRDVVASPGSSVLCQLELERTTNFPDAMNIELIGPATAQGVTADPASVKPGQSNTHVNVHFPDKLAPTPELALNFRATGILRDHITVISETSVPLRWK